MEINGILLNWVVGCFGLFWVVFLWKMIEFHGLIHGNIISNGNQWISIIGGILPGRAWKLPWQI